MRMLTAGRLMMAVFGGFLASIDHPNAQNLPSGIHNACC
jgi:hypothetical protein